MKITIQDNKISQIDAELEIIFIVDKDMNHKFVQDKKLLKKAGFKPSQDATCLFVSKNRLYVAIDTLKSYDIRTASATAIKTIKKTNYKSIKIATYLSHPRCTASIRAMVEGLLLGEYSFENYKSKKSKSKLKEVIISTEGHTDYEVNLENYKKAVKNGEITAKATNFTRDIVNTTPEDCYPQTMANIAKKLAKNSNLECNILKTKELKSENMNALLAVGRASRHNSRVIHLAHKPQNPKFVVSLIGKGLTYDSGGLSLKPADYMVTMKSDKSGGSAVLGLMKAISDMNLPIEVHGFVGAVENMIGGDAFKPDDVLVAKNGKTIEVRNTDAEGRLVLADVLCYAQQEVQADYIFDMATLTGACVVGVGHFTSGVMGNADEPVDMIVNAGKKISGEFASSLEFNRYLKETINSKIADVCNIASTRYGGAITAGMFLSEFIDEHHQDKWAHIDIAGPAFVEQEWGENPHGASGAGVRLVLRAMEKLSRREV